jgi:hypothetical protein
LLAFSLSGVDFLLKSGDPETPLLMSPAYGIFLKPPETASSATTVEISRLRRNELKPLANGSVWWECNTWRLGPTANGRLGIETRTVPDDGWHMAANATADFSSALLCPLAHKLGAFTLHALGEPYDRILITNRLVHFDAGILHGSAIVLDGQGYIFCGRSGAGKTTISRLWRQAGARILNDDRVIVRRQDGRITVAATPWHGLEHEMNTDIVPLRGIFHLHQAPRHQLHRIGASEAVARALATAVAPFYLRGAMERITDLWTDVTERVPSWILDFTPTPDVVEFVRAGTASGD